MSKLSLLLLAASLNFQSSFSQKPEKTQALVIDSSINNIPASDSSVNLFSFQTKPSESIFFPKELRKYFSGGEQLFHVRRLKGGLFILPDGTGQVYQWLIGPDSREFRRIDNTQYAGYNYGAYVFVYQDTLYSFGGYGFWKYNGLLRYYDEQLGGWEIKPLHQEVPVYSLLNNLGQWVDHQDGSLYQISPNMQNPAQSYTDTTRIYKLSILNRQWAEIGTLTADAVSHLIGALKIAELPDGDLVSCGRGGQTILKINYRENSIHQLNKLTSGQIREALNAGDGNKLSWFENGILVIRDTWGDSVKEIELPEDSFVKLPISIYKTTIRPPASFKYFSIAILAIAIGGCLGFIYGRSTSKTQHAQTEKPAPAENLFNPYEINILRGFMLTPDRTMLPEEVNLLLKTDRKSIEVQKKYRSEAIRGINEKCGKILSTTRPIIIQERLTDDRRQFLYKLDQELSEELRKRTIGL